MEENITSIFTQIPLYLVLFNTLILIYILYVVHSSKNKFRN